ncbi:hypothetical protein PTSG_09550 [Salpingoeca rosetta]|uniref:Uncharacterized protein n=1 Tax=Salpingoeca rosetta (strain ATCC 50818 / BSB-021) TaxID=946362 RepID=F2ULB6_SALR5|nr:uncharacterized protein PTSG_09550 [Salpingoeca rosetta]EGD77915.1 hypothetical protein PTSG_09550 [Salpingoeca rosetta]|eukprot:XP_004989979.1 hypothetical protein PTSG_09550 [Salpingoeca rosetta]
MKTYFFRSLMSSSVNRSNNKAKEATTHASTLIHCYPSSLALPSMSDEEELRAVEAKGDALATEDEVVKAFEGASEADNEEAAKLAEQELEHDAAREAVVTEPPKDRGIFERAVKKVLDLREVYEALGYRLSSWGYLGVSVGTSVGISIGLEPIPDAKPKENVQKEDASMLQSVVIGLIKRVNSVLDDLQQSSMRLSRLTISLAGIGLAIPSATASLTFADIPEDEKKKEDKDQHEKEKETRQKAGGSLLSKYAQQLSEFVQRPFTATTAPLVRTLLDEVLDLRRFFSQMGLTVGNLDGTSGWLTARIGTYFGLGFSVQFLDAFSADQELPEGLTLLQRAVLSAMLTSHSLAVKSTAGILTPQKMYVSLSGIGLAIPSVTTTVYMAKADAAQEEALQSLAATLAEEAKPAPEEQQQQQAQGTPEQQGSGHAFVLDSDDAEDSSGSAVARLTRATIRTIYASGEAAGKVLQATTDAIKSSAQRISRVATAPVSEALRNLLTVQDVSDAMPLQLGKPCLSLTFGTQVGAGLRFVERPGMNVLRDKPTITVNSSSHVAVQQLVRGLNFLQSVPGVLAVLRKDHAHADLVTLSFSGLGLGIPAISTGIYLGYKD